jgi:hypothetical protein
MQMTPHVYQAGDFIRVKMKDVNRIGQPSDQAKGKFGKILRRYTAATQILPTIWWVRFD